MKGGRRVIGISGSPIWSKTLMEQIFNPCSEFRWSREGPVRQIHCPHLHIGAPGIFSDLLRSVQMLKREWDAENNKKLPLIFITSQTATLVHELAVKVLLLDRTATLVPTFAVKNLPLGRTLCCWWWRWTSKARNESSAGGNVVMLYSATVSAVRSLAMDDSAGTFAQVCFCVSVRLLAGFWNVRYGIHKLM